MIQGITDINSYLNNVKMQTIWNLNQQDPEKARIAKEQKQKEISKRISDIRSKLKAGKKLSDKELRLLREHAPDLYKKAEAVQQERKNFKEQLKNCKTKEDVQKLFSQKMQFAMSMEKTDQEMTEYLAAAFQEEHKSFMDSDDYKKLNWQIEQITAQQAEQKQTTSKNENEVYQEVFRTMEKWLNLSETDIKTDIPISNSYPADSKEKKSTFTKKV